VTITVPRSPPVFTTPGRGVAGVACVGVGVFTAGAFGCCSLPLGCAGDGGDGALGVGEAIGDGSDGGAGEITRDGGEGSYPRGGTTWPEGIPGDGKICTGGSDHCGPGACGGTRGGRRLCVSVGGGVGAGGGLVPVPRDPFEFPSEVRGSFAVPVDEFPPFVDPFGLPSEVFELFPSEVFELFPSEVFELFPSEVFGLYLV
jgi:hypothetical protein